MYLAADDGLLQRWIMHEVAGFVHNARVSDCSIQHLHELRRHLVACCVAVV
jgi:predicted transcriptional regulator